MNFHFLKYGLWFSNFIQQKAQPHRNLKAKGRESSNFIWSYILCTMIVFRVSFTGSSVLWASRPYAFINVVEVNLWLITHVTRHKWPLVADTAQTIPPPSWSPTRQGASFPIPRCGKCTFEEWSCASGMLPFHPNTVIVLEIKRWYRKELETTTSSTEKQASKCPWWSRCLSVLTHMYRDRQKYIWQILTHTTKR